MKRCMNCMQEFEEDLERCPYCGREYILEPNNGKHLYPGTVLNDRYIIGYSIDINSIFVTYSAFDISEGKKVFINEYLPNNFASRNTGEPLVITKSGDSENKYYSGMKAFADECKDLSAISHTDIIGGFEENNTFYVIRRIVNGTSLAEIIDDDYEITNEYVRRVIVSLLKAISPVHELGIIHGNITPDTVIIDENSTITLIDFGFCGYMARIMPVYTNEGYSPAEQYKIGVKLTTGADIYSIAAIYYELITGEIPVTATTRCKQDTLIPISEVPGVTLRPSVCNAVMNALNIKAENRTPDAITFYEELKSKNTKRHWERYSPSEKPKNNFYKNRSFWLKAVIYSLIAIVIICAAIITFELAAIKKDVEKEKTRETEISTEPIPEDGKSIFDIFGTKEETETTTDEPDTLPGDDVESGTGILSIFKSTD